MATAFTLFATEYLVERLRHIGVVHNFLDDVTFSTHTLSLLAFRPWGPSSSSCCLPNSTPNVNFSAFQPWLLLLWLAPLGTTSGTRPDCCTPIVLFGCLPDASRYSRSHSMHRYSHSRTTRRHSHSRCCCHDKPHGLWGTPPFWVQSYSINTNFENVGVAQTVFRNEIILFILLLIEKKFLSLHAEALKEWHSGI